MFNSFLKKNLNTSSFNAPKTFFPRTSFRFAFCHFNFFYMNTILLLAIVSLFFIFIRPSRRTLTILLMNPFSKHHFLKLLNSSKPSNTSTLATLWISSQSTTMTVFFFVQAFFIKPFLRAHSTSILFSILTILFLISNFVFIHPLLPAKKNSPFHLDLTIFDESLWYAFGLILHH